MNLPDTEPRITQEWRKPSLMPKRSRTGPAGDSFFKASYVLRILHFPTALFSGSHEHSGLSAGRGAHRVLSSTKRNTGGNPSGLRTDAFKAS